MYLWAIGEALVPEAAAIGCGGHSDNSAEDRAEIALVAESHLLADACHRIIGVRKQRLCSLYPARLPGRAVGASDLPAAS